MATITAANAVFALAVTNLFPSPQTLQGFAADAMFAVDETDIAEIVMGVLTGRCRQASFTVPRQ